MSRDSTRRDLARQLRRAMTPAEKILWKHLRGRRFAGFKFRRQHPIGPFFADKACHECKLIVELDGETHLGREADDAERTRYLQERGWLVLRFWNSDVYDDLEAVLETTYRECEQRKAKNRLSAEGNPLTPGPSPPNTGESGEGR